MNDERKHIREYNIKELRALCQSTAPNPAMETYTGRFTRIFSIYLTWVALHSLFNKVTPPNIVILGTTTFFISSLMYFLTFPLTLLGPFFYFLSIVIDGTDGEVARFRKQADLFGGSYVEPVSHDIQYGFFFFIISLALYTQGAPVYVLIIGAVMSISKLLYRLLQIRFWLSFYAGTKRESKEEQLRIHESRPPFTRFLYAVNRNFFTYPGTLGPLLVATIFQRIDLFLYVYAFAYTVLFVLLLIKQIKLSYTR